MKWQGVGAYRWGMPGHPKETPKARAAWTVYRDMGPRRTLAALVEQLGRAPSYMAQVKLWSSRYQWQERAAAHDQAELRAGLGERNYLRERALQNLVEAADRASEKVLEILQDDREIPVLDRDGNVAGYRPRISPAVQLEAAKWVHGTCGIVPVKRMELKTEPDTLDDQADALFRQATPAQLEAIIGLMSAIEGDGDGDAGAGD